MTTLLMFPPQTATTRGWAARLPPPCPNCPSSSPRTRRRPRARSADADAAFGTSPPALLRKAGATALATGAARCAARRLLYPELIAHPVVVTNFREIFNDHIGAHIMAFVLAFARGLHRYIPQQLRREWRPAGARPAT